MPENQLQIIVDNSGLDSTKAKFILDNFKNYFDIAAEWEKKAKTLVVTSPTQIEDMKMARTGRLELKEKRIALEKARKDLKEQSLREGKAIDGISNTLKALIVPIEDYLERQERFVEILEEDKAEARRLEIEKRIAEEDRMAAEKSYAEQELIRSENEKLKKEAQEREKQIVDERKAVDAKIATERAKADAEKKVIEDKARQEKAKQNVKLAAEKAKADAEMKVLEDKANKDKERARAKLEAERKEKERLAQILKDLVECPKCHHRFTVQK